MSDLVQAAEAAAVLWAAQPSALQYVATSENVVYTIELHQKTHYLRLTPVTRRSQSELFAELEFVQYLHANGASVCLPIPAEDGSLLKRIESAEADAACHACVFEAAPGEAYRFHPAVDCAPHFRRVGAELGKIHQLSKSFSPVSTNRRLNWDDDPAMREVKAFLPEHEERVWREYFELTDWLRSQARTIEYFGLIHGDCGSTNYRCASDRVTVFDFDDAYYHWFAYDVAIVLYPHGWRPQASRIYAALVDGYATQTTWKSRGLDEMTNWCRLRMLYVFLHRMRKFANRQLSDEERAWLTRTRANIERGYAWGG